MAAPSDIDSETLAAKRPGREVSTANVLNSGRLREVDGLANAVIDKTLERGLCEDVPSTVTSPLTTNVL